MATKSSKPKKTAAKRTAARPMRSPARQTHYPNCPRCGMTMRQIDMKYNGQDDFGNLYESYHCPRPRCGCRFSITYDGPTDDRDWEYDPSFDY